jgi:SOS-response transcriptional repressor LexA
VSTVPFTPKKDAERPDESTLTDRQRKVLGAIKKHLVEQGFAPSFREIGEAAGLKSPSSVKHQLQVLDDKGFIRMNANKGRAIEVVSFDDDEVSPGKVAQVIPLSGSFRTIPPTPLSMARMLRSWARWSPCSAKSDVRLFNAIEIAPTKMKP